MTVERTPYQDSAVNAVLNGYGNRKGVLSTLRGGSKTEVLLKAPTGSGKTYMVEQILEGIHADAANNGYDVAAVFIAPLTLDQQSEHAFRDYGTSFSTMRLSDFTQPDSFHPGSILFMNYASVNKEKNVARKENERGTNLESVFKSYHETGSKTVLVIDEAHHSAFTGKSREIFDIIDADIVINITATPTQRLLDAAQVDGLFVEVPLEDVVESGMIVESVEWGDNYDLYEKDFKALRLMNDDPNSGYVYQGLRKREELAEACDVSGIPVNPLLFIQIGNDKIGNDGSVKGSSAEKDSKEEGQSLERAMSTLRTLAPQFDLDVDTEVAVWLSNTKTNLNLDNNSPLPGVKVLISKMAVSMGRDIPRISVMAMLRETGSATLNQQSLGRGFRMPEQKHYDDDRLNHLYVYTGFDSIKESTGISTRVPVKIGHIVPGYAWTQGLQLPNYVRVHRSSPSLTFDATTSALLHSFGDALNVPVENVVDLERIVDTDTSGKVSKRMELLGLSFSDSNQGRGIRVGSTDSIDDIVSMNALRRDHLGFATNSDIERRFFEMSIDIVGVDMNSRKALTNAFREIHRVIAKGTNFSFSTFQRKLLSDDNIGMFEKLLEGTRAHLVRCGALLNNRFVIEKSDTQWSVGATYPVPEDNENGDVAHSEFGLYAVNGVSTIGGRLSPGSNEALFLEKDFPFLCAELEKSGISGVRMYKEDRINQSEALALPYEGMTGEARLFYPDWFLFGERGPNGAEKILMIIETKDEKPVLDSDTTRKLKALNAFVGNAKGEGWKVSGAVLNFEGRGSRGTDGRFVMQEDGTRTRISEWVKSI